jgi:hypothetical protein
VKLRTSHVIRPVGQRSGQRRRRPAHADLEIAALEPVAGVGILAVRVRETLELVSHEVEDRVGPHSQLPAERDVIAAARDAE